jgi:hypothetical protein
MFDLASTPHRTLSPKLASWRRYALCLMGFLLAGCTLVAPVPTLPTPVRPPEIQSTAEALQAALDGDFPLDAIAIRYEVGNPVWEGRTTLTVDGSGAVQVTFDRSAAEGEQHGSWQGRLAEAEFLALCRLLVDHEVWAIRGLRKSGVPDEAYPTLTVESEWFDPLLVGMWDGEAREHPDLRPILDVLAGLAYEISGGTAK